MKNTIKQCCLASLIAMACFASVGCDDQKNSAGAMPDPAAQQENTEQQEIAKFNAYVDAANGFSYSAASDLAKHIDYMKRQKKNGDYDAYWVADDTSLKRMAEHLSEARAMKPAMADLDAPAESYGNALNAALPLVKELNDYQDSKGMLADGGQKAREKEEQYVTLMTTLAGAQQNFNTALEKRDDANLRHTFESAKKGSPDYYRSGIALYAKETMNAGEAFFNAYNDEKPSKEIDNQFRQSLDKLAGMNQGCEPLKSEVNDLLGAGRSALRDAEKGSLAVNHFLKSNMSIRMRSDAVNSAYMNLINKMNRSGCEARG